jgi:hypothetical protein
MASFTTIHKLGYVQDTVPESIFRKIKAETDPSTFDFGG